MLPTMVPQQRVLHISGSNVLLSKHQRESTDGFRPPQDVTMTPTASPTGPREAQTPSQEFTDSSLSAITSSPTPAAYVNSRISIKEVSISVHVHIYSYTLCTQLHISHVRGLQFSFKSGNIVKLIYEIRYSQWLYSDMHMLSCPGSDEAVLLEVEWRHLYNNESLSNKWPVLVLCFISIHCYKKYFFGFCTLHIIVIIL